MKYNSFIASGIMACSLCPLAAQTFTQRLTDGAKYAVSSQAGMAARRTPLWLQANRQGLSTLTPGNAYWRAGVERPMAADSGKKWGWSYGFDAALCVGHTATFVVQQAYAAVRFRNGEMRLGAKENRPEGLDPALSSGALTLGQNARPIPEWRLGTTDFVAVPFTKGWLSLKGHVAFGKPTDTHWQHDFTHRSSHYVDGSYYHSKAGYLKIGNARRQYPWSIEVGLEMASQFGGTCYDPERDFYVKNQTGWKAFWHALIPGGGDVPDLGSAYENASGNHLGSWLIRWEKKWKKVEVALYGQKFFEDHSAMFLLDYDGYGTGENWNRRERRRYLLYPPRDGMLGLEIRLKEVPACQKIVVEYLSQKYQSGPIYHDHNPGLPDHIGGKDDYYNHYIFNGWQHWGQVIGNPLFLSPLYNKDGHIRVANNRFTAFHIGIKGEVARHWKYRLLFSGQDGLGTYDQPYTHRRYGFYGFGEVAWQFHPSWELTAGMGLDAGSLRGCQQGVQLTLTKRGLLSTTH